MSQIKQNINSRHSFSAFISQLKDFKAEFGHCNVPIQYSKDKSFGKKVNNYRNAYKNGALPLEYFKELDKLGFVWNVHEQSFSKFIVKLSEFKNEHKHCNVPSPYQKNKWLSEKVKNVRLKYKKGLLKSDHIKQLNDLGFVFDVLESSFDTFIEELSMFKTEFGHCNVPTSYTNSYLGYKVSYYRSKYKSNKLPDSSFQILNALGFLWNPRVEDFDRFITKLKEYKKRNGHCNVPYNYEDDWLAKKVRYYRIEFRNNTLSADYHKKLKSIEVNWEQNSNKLSQENSFNQFIKSLKEYKSKTGNCNVPQSYEDKWLARKVNRLRTKYREGKLASWQIAKLDNIGFVWNMKIERVLIHSNNLKSNKELKA